MNQCGILWRCMSRELFGRYHRSGVDGFGLGLKVVKAPASPSTNLVSDDWQEAGLSTLASLCPEIFFKFHMLP